MYSAWWNQNATLRVCVYISVLCCHGDCRLLSRMAGMKEQQITEEKPLLPEQRGLDADAVSSNAFSTFSSFSTFSTFQWRITENRGVNELHPILTFLLTFRKTKGVWWRKKRQSRAADKGRELRKGHFCQSSDSINGLSLKLHCWMCESHLLQEWVQCLRERRRQRGPTQVWEKMFTGEKQKNHLVIYFHSLFKWGCDLLMAEKSPHVGAVLVLSVLE